MQRMQDQRLRCALRGPTYVSIGPNLRAGLAFIEATFNSPVSISSVSFVNECTHSLSILVATDNNVAVNETTRAPRKDWAKAASLSLARLRNQNQSSNEDEQGGGGNRPSSSHLGKLSTWRWRPVLNRKRLMPDAHCIEKSRGQFVISCQSERALLTPMVQIRAVRLVLKQPSPVWSRFGIANIKFYGTCSDFNEIESINDSLDETENLANLARTTEAALLGISQRKKNEADIKPFYDIITL